MVSQCKTCCDIRTLHRQSRDTDIIIRVLLQLKDDAKNLKSYILYYVFLNFVLVSIN